MTWEASDKYTTDNPAESELNVLGSMMLDPECIPSVRAILPDGTYFSRMEYQNFYNALLEFCQGHEGFDPVLFRNWLKETNRYHSIGGTDMMLKVADSTCTSANAVYHARHVAKGAIARHAKGIAEVLAGRIAEGYDISEAMAAASKDLGELARESSDPTVRCLETTCADAVAEQKLQWFWPNRIPAGMYSFLVGDPGAGKSFLSCYIASIATRGALWADGTWAGDPMDVLMFITEDNLSRTVVPRLNAHCADLSRVHFCRSVRAGSKESHMFMIQRNMDMLESFLDKHPACRLITLDPVTAFMGDVNQNSQSEVRSVLGEICRLAEQRNVTILGLSHLNKKVDLDMRHRSIGSVAFNAVPRAVWGVYAIDDEAPSAEEGFTASSDDARPSARKRFLFPIKDNLCIEPTAMEFTIDGGRVQFGRQVAAGEVNTLLKPDRQSVQKHVTKKERAKQLILELLKNGSVESEKLIQQVMQDGMGEQTVRYARKELREAGKIDCHNPEKQGWIWFIVRDEKV